MSKYEEQAYRVGVGKPNPNAKPNVPLLKSQLARLKHDLAQFIARKPDGSVIVDGSLPIRDINRALDWSLPDEEATTIAGLVIHETQTIPEVKQAFTFYGKRFSVLKKEKNRLTRLRIVPLDADGKPAPIAVNLSR